jgi:WD40 repeat protein/serine/threonine protein kinase/tetratricopeptide (TPR) repeat protein
MAEKNRCLQCGADLPANAPHGVCPQCLIKVGFEGDANVTLDISPSIEGPGTKIGHYELLNLIGEGGMGLVYLAEQKEPVRRKVVLKIVKPGMDSKQVIARFEAERQALAVLDHPNIAHVFDAGATAAGRPYFVMEYVKGMSITRYCDEKKLNIEQRLRLFEQVCEGVHHAHQKGIIHRDLKPSNILVSVHGDRAVPKIIDFGIAKAITQPLTDKTFVTFQGQLLGTPEYMSPEQVDLATQDIDTRSDIYSLGVVLYELLAGVLPFEEESFARAGLAEIQRAIRESEPASPSIRLTSLGEKAKTIAASRGTQVVPLARRLHRELEWIPLKAMRKDRCRRYRSATEMADDIRNYLTGLPLIAGPETAIYRVQKFVRKHVGSVATVALVALAIVLGLIVSLAMYFKAENAHKKEVVARTEAEDARVVAEKAKGEEASARVRAEEAERMASKQAEDYRRLLYASRIALAETSIRHHDAGRIHELLSSCPNDLRGWEWNYLWHASDESIQTFRVKGSSINAFTLSPDSKKVAAVIEDGTIRIWDAQTGIELIKVSACIEDITCLALSHDGKRLLLNGADNIVRICDVANGQEIVTLPGHKGPICFLAFSPDDAKVISASRDGAVRVWNSLNGAELLTTSVREDWVNDVALSRDGDMVVLGNASGVIRVLDISNGAERMMSLKKANNIIAVAISPDGSRIVSTNDAAINNIWDVKTGVEISAFETRMVEPGCVMFSSDGNSIISGDCIGKLRVFDASSGRETNTYHGHEGEVLKVAVSSDGKQYFSYGSDDTIKVWDTMRGNSPMTLQGHERTVWPVTFSPDSKHIVSADEGGVINVWDISSGSETLSISGHKYSVWALAYSPDGQQILSGSADRTVRLWDTTTGEQLMSLITLRDDIGSTLFSPDGRSVLLRSWSGEILLIDSKTGAIKLKLRGYPSSVSDTVFYPDGSRIIGAYNKDTVKIWDSVTGEEVKTMYVGVSPVRCITFSPDGKHVVFGGDDNIIRMWDLEKTIELKVFHVGPNGVIGVVFSPDGKRLAAADRLGNTIRIWNVETDDEVLTTYVSGASINSLTFSPDGQTLAVSHGCTITLLESSVPPKGYPLRNVTRAAQLLVNQLYQQHGYYYDVVRELETDNELEESVRKIAIKIATLRQRYDVWKLNEECWQVVISSESDISDYNAALNKAKMAIQLEPEDVESLNMLGAALYRVNSYEQAASTLSRVEQMNESHGVQTNCNTLAFKTMSLLKLGNRNSARLALAQLRRRFSGYRGIRLIAVEPEAHLLLLQAEKLFAGDNPKVSSLWRSIEVNKLDDAVLQVKELKSLKDPYVDEVIEGAVSYLAQAYFRNAATRIEKGKEDYARTIEDFGSIVSVDPNNASALINLAQLLATCIEVELRNAPRAVEAASRACLLNGWKDPSYVSTLAAAYSEIGDFDSAVTYQRRALELLSSDAPMDTRALYETRLRLYESQKPYHTGSQWSFSHGNLVAWWKFDAIQEGKIVDLSGNGLHARLMGDAHIIVDPERKNVLSLDGNGDYVDCGNNEAFDISGALTVAAWAKSTPFKGFRHTLVAKGDSWNLTGTRYDVPAFHCWVKGQIGEVTGNASVGNERWHHIVAIYDGREMKLYIDGKLDNSVVGCSGIRTSEAPLWIGENSETPGISWNGLIDDVRIYSYALSPEEVKMLYEGKEPPREKKSE